MTPSSIRDQLAVIETLRAHPGWALVHDALEDEVADALGALAAPGVEPYARAEAVGRYNAAVHARDTLDRLYSRLQEMNR